MRHEKYIVANPSVKIIQQKTPSEAPERTDLSSKHPKKPLILFGMATSQRRKRYIAARSSVKIAE
jgi:hypothetical protein